MSRTTARGAARRSSPARASRGERVDERHLSFESWEGLSKVLTASGWTAALRQPGGQRRGARPGVGRATTSACTRGCPASRRWRIFHLSRKLAARRRDAVRAADITASRGPRQQLGYVRTGLGVTTDDAMGVRVRRRSRRGQGRDEGAARRQGRQSRRDEQSRPAGAAGLHHLDRGLHLVLRQRPRLPGRPGGAGRRGPGRRRARSSACASAMWSGRSWCRCAPAPRSRCPA